MSKESFNIPDGEYEIDMSSLFAPLQNSDVFGLRFGFKPDTIDEQFPSILLREKSTDNFILQTESKENPKAIINNNSIQNNKSGINQILFDGKLQSNALSLNSTGITNNDNNNLILLDENSDIPSLLSGKQQKSEFVLIYDNISNEFKMETFNGIIKMSKSREPNILNNKFNDLLNDYKKLNINEFNKLTDDILSSNSELNNSNNDNISPSRSTKPRRITTLVPPPINPAFNNGSSSSSSSNINQHIGSPTISSPSATIQKIQRKANGAMKLTPSNGAGTKSRVKIPVSRSSASPKISNASPTSSSVMSLKRAAMSSKNFGENKDINRVKQQSATSNRKSSTYKSRSNSQSQSPAPQSIEIPSSANNSEFFSDEDLENFAEELEDELDTDKNSDTGYSDNDVKSNSSNTKTKSNGKTQNDNHKNKTNIIKQEPEVIELGKGSDEEWQVNLSDWEDDAFDFDDDSNNGNNNNNKQQPVSYKKSTSNTSDNLALQATPQPMKENNHINSIQEIDDEFDDEDFDIEFEDVEDEDRINDNENNDNDKFGLIVEDDPFASKRVNNSRSSTPNTSTNSNSSNANANNGPISIRQLAAVTSSANNNNNNNNKNSTPSPSAQILTPRLDTPRYDTLTPRLDVASPRLDSFPDRASRRPTTGRKSTAKSTATITTATTSSSVDDESPVPKPKSRAGRPKGSKNKTKKTDKASTAQKKVPETIEIADDFDEDELDKVMDDYDFDISDTEETDNKNSATHAITIDGDDDEEMSEEE